MVSSGLAVYHSPITTHTHSSKVMAKRLTVVVSQAQSSNPAKRQLEEDIVAALLFEPGIDVVVIPHLYDLTADSTGMLALSGFPLFFSGFWSKDSILHETHHWRISQWPFYLGLFAAFLTAFYMTRQVFYVFFGTYRLPSGKQQTSEHASNAGEDHEVTSSTTPHESPPLMTVPLIILAAFSILLGFLGTPAWPWFQDFLIGHTSHFEIGKLLESEVLRILLLSSAIVALGIGLGWWLYGRKPVRGAEELDILEQLRPDLFTLLRRKYFVDEIYEYSIVRLNAWWARACDWFDDVVWNGAVQLVSYLVLVLSWLNRFLDESVVNGLFDESCRRIAGSGGLISRLQSGRIQNYLRFIGIALIVLVLFLIWGCRGS